MGWTRAASSVKERKGAFPSVWSRETPGRRDCRPSYMQVRFTPFFSLSLGCRCCPAIPRTRRLINIYFTLLCVSLLIITSFKCPESHTQEKASFRDSRFKDTKTLVRLPSDRRIPDRLRTQSHTHTHTHTFIHPPHHLAHATKKMPPGLRFQAPAASSAPARPRPVSGAAAAAEDDNDDDDNNEGDETVSYSK